MGRWARVTFAEAEMGIDRVRVLNTEQEGGEREQNKKLYTQQWKGCNPGAI